jgi:hypothetical protein
MITTWARRTGPVDVESNNGWIVMAFARMVWSCALSTVLQSRSASYRESVKKCVSPL